MKPEDLDRALSGEPDIVPSSGFVAAVMDAVVAEATAPPLPFPWKRAWPFAAGFVVLLFWLAFRSPAATPGPDLYAWFKTIVPMATGWVAGALVMTIALTVWSLGLSFVRLMKVKV
jgi:hypothetical protein